MTRQLTSHERTSGSLWDASYTGTEPAPWEIDGPQPAVVRLAALGLVGPVLDVGCGTGENALHLAALSLPVLGVDVARTAVAAARVKASERGVDAEFLVADALDLTQLERTFATVLDCGLFHTFDAGERTQYVAALAAVLRPGGELHLFCFRDAGSDGGPHPVSEAELRAPFVPGSWEIVALEPEWLRTRFHAGPGAPAWHATVRR
jgi:SAM-dependent methyltransferase